MNQPCEITGLSKDNVEKLSYLHDYITKDKEIPIPDNESLNGFIKPLENTVSSHKIHSSEQKRRDSLFKHLEKSIASKFEGSKLSAFGSALGIAFQIQDDILDATGDDQALGKRSGADTRQSKSTYVSLLGIDRAQDALQRMLEQSRQSLDDVNLLTPSFDQLIHFAAFPSSILKTASNPFCIRAANGSWSEMAKYTTSSNSVSALPIFPTKHRVTWRRSWRPWMSKEKPSSTR